MKFGLTDITISKINSVFRNHPEIDSVLIYGSRAKGNYRAGSDIDITLIGEEITHTLLSLVMQEIDDLNTPYLFDISIYNSLKGSSLKEHIDRVGQELYGKQ